MGSYLIGKAGDIWDENQEHDNSSAFGGTPVSTEGL